MREKPYTCLAHTDCFANRNGLCTVLTDTDFQGKDCPFHKTSAQAQEGRRSAYFRLITTGQEYLLDKYGVCYESE